jgi:hypothetical protein
MRSPIVIIIPCFVHETIFAGISVSQSPPTGQEEEGRTLEQLGPAPDHRDSRDKIYLTFL